MREELSLTYAKQYLKRNIGKYEPGDAFESAIGEYYLRQDEIDKLFEYAMKTIKYESYKKEIQRRYEFLKESE